MVEDDLGKRDERVEIEREEGEFWGRNGMENEALTSRGLWPEAGTAMHLMPGNTGRHWHFCDLGHDIIILAARAPRLSGFTTQNMSCSSKCTSPSPSRSVATIMNRPEIVLQIAI